MTGGRIGKDGIHGATFSSEELHEGSPVTAVQIGDPITQKKMTDFLLVARDRGLYRAITDNGAGGLSSSVGEMARLSGGCELDLEKAPLKYPGLNPWEILISESQERMTARRAPEKIDEFLDLAAEDGRGGDRPGPLHRYGHGSTSATGKRPWPIWTWTSSTTACPQMDLRAAGRPRATRSRLSRNRRTWARP